MARISNEELDGLSGEVLPERAVLSAMVFHGHGGTTIGYACEGSTGASAAPNLLQDPARALAVAVAPAAAAPGGHSLQCFPAAVVTH